MQTVAAIIPTETPLGKGKLSSIKSGLILRDELEDIFSLMASCLPSHNSLIFLSTASSGCVFDFPENDMMATFFTIKLLPETSMGKRKL